MTAPVVPEFAPVGPYCSGASISDLPTTSSNGIIGTWAPAINNTETTTYTFTPTAGQCAATAILTITINPLVTPTFAAVGPYCSGASIPALPTTSINNITGSWSPTIDNTTTTTYTFTPTAGQCATTTTLTITINSLVTPTFAAVGPYCSGASIPALPTTSINGITGSWSPTIDNTTTTTYTFTPTAGQCATTATLTITINPSVTPTFAAVGPYCSGASIPALPTTSINGITGSWSPAINNTATTTYTFTPTPGPCATTATLTITINSNVTPTFAAVGPFCSGASIPALPTTSINGITGSWSPAINNTATTTYTFTPTAGQCATTTTLTITINSILTPTFAAVGPYCSGASIPSLPTTSINGIAGSWSPAINNTATTTYTFTPTAGQCATTATLTITINPSLTPTFAAVGPYCSGASIPSLPTTSTNGITGSWSPAINNTATTTYTFTPTAGLCATTTTLTITINANVTPTFSAVGPYCSGASIPALPTTSTNGITGSWSPAINNTATTTYTFTPTPGPCATTATLTITINSNVTPTFAAVGPFCSGASIPALPTTSINGITGSWSPAINNTATTTYTFTPTAGQCATTTTLTITINSILTPTFAAVGPYCSGASIPSLPTTSINGIAGSWSPAINNTATTTYTFTPTAGQCATTATLTITINPSLTPTFAAVGPYCSGASIPSLPTTSTNGITGSWSPAINNTATTTYTFTPTAGLCATTTTLTITINANVTPSFAAVGPYCSGASIAALPTTSTNGITGSWSPAINNTATTTYTFTPTAGLCATIVTLTITINPNVTPTFASVGPYCSGASIPALPTTSINGITGSWSPAINNTATTTYTFTPTAGQCATTTTLTITINANVTPSFAAVGPYCSGASIPSLPTSSTNGITGFWSPAINNTATTTYTFTPTVGQCATTTTLTITINPRVTPTFSAVGPYCSGASIPALPTTSTNGITGTWSPAINNTATTTYTFTPTAGLCATTATLTITINPNVTPTFSSVGPYCSGASIPALPTTSTNGITGSWSPAINNSVTTTYTFTPTAGLCATTTTMTITINANVTPTFSAVGPYCSGASIPALPTTSINGITGSWSPGINNTATTTYTFTPTAGQCATTAILTITVNVTPTAPIVGTITHPTCTVATGSVILSGLPAAGTWTLTRSPGGTTSTGTGTSTTISALAAGTYTFTVTSSSGCTSPASANVVINTNPSTPTSPLVGTITQTTCSVSTGSVVLSGLPATGTWTLTRTPGGTTTSGTGTSTTISGLAAGTYTFTVTNASGCTSPASANVIINAQPVTPTAPTVGTITHPTCTVATGSVTLNGLPSSGTWTLTRTPGGTTTSGTGASTTISGLAAGTYTFTVTNSSGCTSSSSGNVVLNAQPSTPTIPSVGTISHPTCFVATGSAVLNGLPSTGTWTLTRTPGGTATTGTGTSTTISGLAADTYTFTVTNSSGCTSSSSANVVINAQPITPAAPTAGTVTHPTCTVATGSVVLSGLPSTGTWTLTRTPGGTITSGTGTSTTISGLAADAYTFTVTNASGCTSSASANVIINAQPVTPAAPTVGIITHPTCAVASGSVVLNGLPASGTWTLTRNPGGTITSGTGTSTTVSAVSSGTYTFTVTNASGCTSLASANVVINANPSIPTPPVVGAITQPTCTVATGSVVLSGLPATGTWTLTRTPGGIITTGTGTSSTISGLAAGTYTFTVAFEAGCTSAASGNVVINAQPVTPTAPAIGTITQPTCTVATGSVILNGLPPTGTWTLTRAPGGTTATGSGISTTISGLIAGIYTFTATNSSGCISPASANIAINPQPATPTAPTVGTITQPTCTVATGSVVLNGLPPTGTWTITRTPGGTTNTGTGSSTTISGIPAASYTFTVTNDAGCTSTASGNAVINVQPPTPTAPAIGTITQPSITVPTGSVILNGLPATGSWLLTRTPGNIITSGTGTSSTITGLAAGTYTFIVTNASGCPSPASATVGFYTLTLFDPSDKILHPNDTIKINSSEAGSFSISVESNTEWTVSDNSLWLRAVKESSKSSINVTYLENISAIDKVAALRVEYTSNPEMVFYIRQKARISQLMESKFENVKMYPNPAGDYVYLKLGEKEFGKIIVTITNMQGHVVFTEAYNNLTSNHIIELDVSGCHPGQYFISIGDGTNHRIFQMIKN